MLTFLIAICIFSAVHAANLEIVHDEELLNLIKTEKYVVVLFSKFVFFSSVSLNVFHMENERIKRDNI